MCRACKRVGGWNLLTDTEDHYRILVSLMDYQTDGDTVKAKEKLTTLGVDFEDTLSYLPEVAKLIKEIGEATNPVGNTDNTLVEYGE